jgi:hypothetical protein
MAEDDFIEKIKTIGIITRTPERLPLGEKARSRFVPPKDGRQGVCVLSEGALEKEEIDYIVEAHKQKEDERIKKGIKRPKQERLGAVLGEVVKAPAGKRADTAREIIKEV